MTRNAVDPPATSDPVTETPPSVPSKLPVPGTPGVTLVRSKKEAAVACGAIAMHPTTANKEHVYLDNGFIFSMLTQELVYF